MASVEARTSEMGTLETNPYIPWTEYFKSLIHDLVKKRDNTLAFGSWTDEGLWEYIGPFAEMFPQIVKEKNQLAIDLLFRILSQHGKEGTIAALRESVQWRYNAATQWEERQGNIIPSNPTERVVEILTEERA